MDDFDVVTGTPPQLKSLKPAVPPPRAESSPLPAADPILPQAAAGKPQAAENR